MDMTSIEKDVINLRIRVFRLEDEIDFIYKHLGVTYKPDTSAADPRIIEQLQKGNMLDAIKIHRELNNSNPTDARNAVEALKGKLGLS
jgi:hypothetical protein